MNNNDIFKKLRVALQLRDDQIVAILELVDFRISKGEIGNFFRNEDHPKFMECGDQVLRNFLNGLVIHLRGTKENPKNPMEVLEKNKEGVKTAATAVKKQEFTPKPKQEEKKKPAPKKAPFKQKKQQPIVEKVRFKNGKNKNS
ncbi:MULTISPECIES: DUF1456 family protein [Flavobacterium]|uniref:DUF1456 family protein n=1 Tax=Flavobacterium TaxID=237 RepID=UPI00086CCB79|nr:MULTISPECIES: DUF1456 family protein [Flavobacterium]MBN9285005.1 DUF1456 family protein [Flavobacterium sp.]ODS78750.1 MAG: hypothetical protein ABS44_21570 [Chryseobacterium sp. SCN 40-13]OJV72308.1 MAG: hypothetical protein BGO42_03750 [Flavobacterium sp. 40-81]